jgi:hypothetical protein
VHDTLERETHHRVVRRDPVDAGHVGVDDAHRQWPRAGHGIDREITADSQLSSDSHSCGIRRQQDLRICRGVLPGVD